jgi:hypothetical protein
MEIGRRPHEGCQRTTAWNFLQAPRETTNDVELLSAAFATVPSGPSLCNTIDVQKSITVSRETSTFIGPIRCWVTSEAYLVANSHW